ncbi:MAG TPA: hypothetical protein VF128_13330, partial [Gemmatimonadaceae bacterium]
MNDRTGIDAHLVPQECRISSTVAECRTTIAGRLDRGHQVNDGLGAQRLQLLCFQKPLGRATQVAAIRRCLRFTVEHFDKCGLQPLAFSGSPVLEGRRFVDKEAIQKRTTVCLNGCVKIPFGTCTLEPLHIAGHECAVQPKIVHAREDALLTEIAADRIEQLRERVPRTAGIVLGPEVRNHLVATDTSISRNGQHGQER